MRNRSLITALSSALLLLFHTAPDAVEGSKPFDVKVTLRGKKYTIPNVSTVRELQKGVEEQAGLSPVKQGVLFGGKKLKPSDILEDMGVEDGSLINIVPTSSKKKSSSSSSSSSAAASAGAAASVGANGDVSSETSSSSSSLPAGGMGGGNFMADMLKESGIDSDQLDELMKMMPGGGEDGGMPNMQESMEMMQSMMSSPLFQEYMRDPEKLEQSRQMILQNPLMKSMMAGMPGFDEILNDEVKWRETMIAAAEMYQQMGSSLMDAMQEGGPGGMGGAPGGMGSFGGMSALDELSEGE